MHTLKSFYDISPLLTALAVLLFVVALVTSCAASVAVLNIWRENRKERKYRKLMYKIIRGHVTLQQ